MSIRLGIDIGSTTVKVTAIDESGKLLFRSYERHYSRRRGRDAAVSIDTCNEQATIAGL